MKDNLYNKDTIDDIDEQKFNYKEVLLLIFAAYKTFLPRFAVPLISLIVISAIISIWL